MSHLSTMTLAWEAQGKHVGQESSFIYQKGFIRLHNYNSKKRVFTSAFELKGVICYWETLSEPETQFLKECSDVWCHKVEAKSFHLVLGQAPVYHAGLHDSFMLLVSVWTGQTSDKTGKYKVLNSAVCSSFRNASFSGDQEAPSCLTGALAALGSYALHKISHIY